jgi:5-oxoprolinase (ATP-hydrolysing) subunit A
MQINININADVGESFGHWRMGSDDELMPLIDSASIACGMHAGDPLVMAGAVASAIKHGASVGAHPGFNDLWGFGRRAIRMAPHDLEHLILYQIGALQAIARAHGTQVGHVKPHGALNNMAHDDADLASALARGVQAADPALIFVASVGSQMAVAAGRIGLRVANEIYADRRYGPGGHLLSRERADALISDPVEAVAHVLRMIHEQAVFSVEGERLPTPIHTVCVHGDGPHALAIASAVRAALQKQGMRLGSLDQVVG